VAIEHTFNSANQRNLLEPLLVYFAGKVRKGSSDYRRSLFQDDRIMSRAIGSEHSVYDNPLDLYDLGTVRYGGPSALSCDHGCWHKSNHGINNPFAQDQTLFGSSRERLHDVPVHGREYLYAIQQETSCPDGENGLSRSQVLERCMYQIRTCDALYAFIDSPDCYGTLAEIGYAYALGVPIYIVFDDRLKDARDEYEEHKESGHDFAWMEQTKRNDFWFAAQMATQCEWGPPWALLSHIAYNKNARRLNNPIKRSAIKPKDRVAILVRDKYTCQMCGASRSNGAVLEIDHIHPVSKGGTNDAANLQVLCRECNAGKSNHIIPMP
jgi:hypothetical protein